MKELGAMVEPLGQRAKAQSGIQRLEAETKDHPAMTPMETSRPAAIPPHRWWAEGEQRGCQTTAEVVGEGGWAGVQNAQGVLVRASQTHHKAKKIFCLKQKNKRGVTRHSTFLCSPVFCHTTVRLNAWRRQRRISNNTLIIHRRVIHNRQAGHTCREHSQYQTQEDEQTRPGVPNPVPVDRLSCKVLLQL